MRIRDRMERKRSLEDYDTEKKEENLPKKKRSGDNIDPQW